MHNLDDQVPSALEGESEQAGLPRRELVTAVLGAMGATVLFGCEGPAKVPQLQRVASALSTGAVLYFDCITGTSPTLKSTPGTTAGQCAVVAGRSSIGDGGGGVFFWTADTTTADNDGTIFTATETTRTGCWKRLYFDQIDAAWFGASPGSSDNATALNNALTAAGVTGETVFLGGGDFKINSGLKVKSNSRFVGLKGKTKLRAWATFSTMVEIESTSSAKIENVDIRGIYFDANEKADHAIRIFGTVQASDDFAAEDITIEDNECFEALKTFFTCEKRSRRIRIIGNFIHSFLHGTDHDTNGIVPNYLWDSDVCDNRFESIGKVNSNGNYAIQGELPGSTVGGVSLRVSGNKIYSCNGGMKFLCDEDLEQNHERTRSLIIDSNIINGGTISNAHYIRIIGIVGAVISNNVVLMNPYLHEGSSFRTKNIAIDVQHCKYVEISGNVINGNYRPDLTSIQVEQQAIQLTSWTTDVNVTGNVISNLTRPRPGQSQNFPAFGVIVTEACENINIVGNNIEAVYGVWIDSTSDGHEMPSTPTRHVNVQSNCFNLVVIPSNAIAVIVQPAQNLKPTDIVISNNSIYGPAVTNPLAYGVWLAGFGVDRCVVDSNVMWNVKAMILIDDNDVGNSRPWSTTSGKAQVDFIRNISFSDMDVPISGSANVNSQVRFIDNRFKSSLSTAHPWERAAYNLDQDTAANGYLESGASAIYHDGEDDIVVWQTSAGNVTVYLRAGTSTTSRRRNVYVGRKITVKDGSGFAGTSSTGITVTARSHTSHTDTIDGAASYFIGTAYGSATFMYIGNDRWVVL